MTAMGKLMNNNKSIMTKHLHIPGGQGVEQL